MTHSVLFVDDEKSICSALKRSFRKSPYIVYEANSGEQALSLLEDNDVDVVISDQRMPGMNGTQLLTIIKNQYPSIGRVMLSGYSDFDALTDAVNEANIFRFLPKPWNDETLLQTVGDAIHHVESDACYKAPTILQNIQKTLPLVPRYNDEVNDIAESFLKKQVQLEQDINNDELDIIESTVVDMDNPGHTLHYFLLSWPRFERFSHENIIDMAKQAGYLSKLYTWYSLKSADTCHAQHTNLQQTGKKIVIDLFCQEMISNKSLRSIILSIMREKCHIVFRIPFSLLETESLTNLLKETYISSASIMLNIGKRIIDVNDLENTSVEYLEMDARYNTMRNHAITQKRIKMLDDAQNLSIKTILTEVKNPEQFLYAKELNVDFFSSKLHKNTTVKN